MCIFALKDPVSLLAGREVVGRQAREGKISGICRVPNKVSGILTGRSALNAPQGAQGASLRCSPKMRKGAHLRRIGATPWHTAGSGALEP